MRPSQAKTGGGGFLNGVAAKITGYEFVLTPDMEIKKGKRAGQTWSPVSFIPAFRVDGADADVSSRFLLGDADRLALTVSEDGQTVTLGEDVTLFADNEVIAFIQSLVAADFPEDRLDSDPLTINLEPIVGTRVMLEQVVNEEKTKNQGKQVSAKTGKSYDRKDLRVAQIIELPSVGKANGKAPSKGNGKVKGTDIAALGRQTVLDVLGDTESGSLPFGKLKMLAFGKFDSQHPQKVDRDAVLKFIGDSTNVAQFDGVTLDGKKQILSLS